MFTLRYNQTLRELHRLNDYATIIRKLSTGFDNITRAVAVGNIRQQWLFCKDLFERLSPDEANHMNTWHEDDVQVMYYLAHEYMLRDNRIRQSDILYICEEPEPPVGTVCGGHTKICTKDFEGDLIYIYSCDRELRGVVELA